MAHEDRSRDRYPYRHHGPAVHGSKMIDYLISELALREDCPELFADEAQTKEPKA